jgi:hypothetical protein
VFLPNEQVLAKAVLQSDAKAYCSWQILGQDTNGIYAWVLCEMQVAPFSSASMPAAIQLDGQGHYMQVSIPRDGALYVEDVQKLFPADVQTIVLGREIDNQGLEWGIAQRKAGKMTTAYTIPFFPGNEACKWVMQFKQDLLVASGEAKNGWKTYTQAEDGFALDVPSDWDVFEIRVVCPDGQDEPHSLYLRLPDPSYQLTISFRIPDQPVYITRTGTPAGDFVDAGTVSFLGVELPVQRLVYQDQGQARDMAVFYSGGGEFLAGGLLFTAGLDIMQDPKNNQSIPADLEDLAKRVLESFRSLSPAGPILTPTPVTTPPEANASLALQAQAGGSVSGVALLGSTAFVGLGPHLAAIDVSDPAFPQLEAQSSVLPGNVSGVLVLSTDPYPQLVVSAGRYIVTLSLAADGQISVIGETALPGNIQSIVLDASNGLLYAAGSIYQSYDANSGDVSTGFVAVVGVNDPSGPQYYGQQLALADNVQSLALTDSMLYVGLYNSQGFKGIAGIPLTDQTEFGQPTIVIPPADNDEAPYTMAVYGDRLYVGSYMAMSAYDISKPEAPQRVWRATKDDNGQVMMMVYGFVLHGSSIDMAGCAPADGYVPWQSSFTPPEPVTGDAYGEVSSMTAGTGHLLLIARDGLEIYDTSDPKALKAVGVYHPNRAYIIDHVTGGNYVYTIDTSAQGWDNQYLNVLRASDLAVAGVYHFELPDHSALWDWYRGMALDGDRLYVFGRFGVWIFDVSNPIKPVLLSRPSEMANAMDGGAALTADGRRLVAALNRVDDTDILKIYDATDPRAILTLDTSASFNGEQVVRLAWDGKWLYALASTLSGPEPEDWFYVLSFKADKLSFQSKMQLAWVTTGMAVQGDLVALAGSPGLTLLSVADPTQPKVLLQTPLAGGTADVGFEGNRLVVLVVGETAQVLTFDVSDPSQKGAVPVGAVEVPLAGQFMVLHVSGGTISLSGDASGVEILK